MNELIIYDKGERKELSSLKNPNDFNDFEDKLFITLGECSVIIGKRKDEDDYIAAAKILAPFIRQNYPNYTIKEIISILKNGFISNGEEYLNVSPSSCSDIIKKHHESIYNRTKLEEARKKEAEILNEQQLERIEFLKNKKTFYSAKKDYEENCVTDEKIKYSYYRAHDYLLEKTKEKYLGMPKEEAQKLWEEVKNDYLNQESEEKKGQSILNDLLEFAKENMDQKEILTRDFKGRLFHFWAIENFNNE